MKTSALTRFHRIGGGFVVAAIIMTAMTAPASAAQITNRSVLIGSSVASATTTYQFTFTVPSTTVIKSAEFQACTTASGACTTPAGFSNASASLSSQPTNFGSATGWTIDNNTAGSLRLSNSGNATAPSGNQSVTFANVVNPSAVNSTYYFRITSYSAANWTGSIDTGTVATSTAGQVNVTASVDETLTFTLANSTVPLGTLTTSTTGSGTANFSVVTNASRGYNVTYSGTTLTAGANNITALTSPTASTAGSRQFGFNLVANTAPAVGSNVTGGGSGTVSAGYNTANSYKFASGDTIATASVPTNSNTYTASYIANIDGVTAPGLYSTSLTYVATANF